MATEEERREYLYRSVGEALHLAQTLELQVATLITIVNRTFHTKIDVDGLIVPDHGKTLGQLIRQLRAVGTVDDNGKRILEEALDRRNYIAHHFFKRNTWAFSVDDVFCNARDALMVDTKTIAMGVAVTQGWVAALCEALKLPKKEILFEQD